MLSTSSVLLELAQHPLLDPAGAKQLSRHQDPQVRASVLAHPQTSEATRTSRMNDSHVLVRRAAHATTTDTTHLAATRDTAVEKAVGIAANPLTDPTTLAELLNHDSVRVVREALANPSTPKKDVLEAARRHHIGELYPTGVTAQPIGGADWAMDVHPEIGAIWAAGPSSPAFRVIAAHPQVDREAIELLSKRRRGGWITTLTQNPYIADTHLEHLPAGRLEKRKQLKAKLGTAPITTLAQDPTHQRALATLCSPTIDRHLAESPNLLLSVAIFMVSRPKVEDQVYGKTLALLVNRFGGEIAERAVHTMSGARILGSAPESALLEYATRQSRRPEYFGAHRATPVLENLEGRAERWEAFLSLLPDWQHTPEELAETTRSL